MRFLLPITACENFCQNKNFWYWHCSQFRKNSLKWKLFVANLFEYIESVTNTHNFLWCCWFYRGKTLLLLHQTLSTKMLLMWPCESYYFLLIQKMFITGMFSSCARLWGFCYKMKNLLSKILVFVRMTTANMWHSSSSLEIPMSNSKAKKALFVCSLKITRTNIYIIFINL